MIIKNDILFGLYVAVGLLILYMGGCGVASYLKGPTKPCIHLAHLVDIHIETEHERDERDRYKEDRDKDRYEKDEMDKEERERFEMDRVV